jgi:hypothetical protein
VADQLAGQALALEPPVVAAARTGRVGGTTRRALSAQIAELEGVARRLMAAANDTGAEVASRGTWRVDERLAALEVARRELTEIDVRAGLHLQR